MVVVTLDVAAGDHRTPGPSPRRTGEVVPCALDAALTLTYGAAGLQALTGLAMAAGDGLVRLAEGGLYRGALPDPEIAHPELARFEAGVRVGPFRRIGLTLTRTASGWLMECRDETAVELAGLLDLRARASGGDVPALLAVLRDALRLDEVAFVPAGEAERPAAPSGSADGAGGTARLAVDLSDDQGRFGALRLGLTPDAPPAADLADWLGALAPRLCALLRSADSRARLAEAEAWTASVLAASAEGYVSFEGDRIAFFSPGAERMFGRAGEAARGLPAEALFDGAEAAVRIRELLHGEGGGDDAGGGPGGTTAIEAVARRADGSTFPAVVRLAAASRRTTLVFEDVSARHASESSLRRTRGQIAAILDSLRDAVVAVDQDLTLVYANDAAGALLSSRPEDMTGRPVWDGALPLWDLLGPDLFRCVRHREKQEQELRWPTGEQWFDARILPTDGGASVFLLDVTHRRRAADLQRQSETLYRTVSELTTDLIFCYRVEPTGLLVREWNVGRTAGVLGRDLPESLPAASLLALVHPHDRALGAEFTRSLLGGQDVSGEVRIILPGGASRWVEVHAQPQRDGQGKVERLLFAIRDIAARKRIETALRESEERFALAVEGAAEGLWDWDLRRRTIFRSEQLRCMLGLPPEVDIQRYGWWAEQIHPEDLEGYREALRRYRRSGDSLFAAEYRVGHRDGSWRWLLDRAVSRRGADGRVERIVGAVTDISERKNMELQLKAASAAIEEKNQQIQVALDNISQGLLMFDASDRLTLFNRRFAELYGLVGELHLGMRRCALERAVAASGRHDRDEAIAMGQSFRPPLPADPSRTRHLVQRLHAGKAIEVVTSRLPGGGTVSTFTDITPREEREQELRAARDAAEAANRAKSAFLANMSHELRTPLNAVIGFSDVMKAEMFGPLGNDMYLSYASDIHASGQLLLDLINDILDISKIEAGKAEVAEEAVALAEVVEASVLLCREQAQAASLVLRTRVAGDLPRLRGDARYIRQILVNLLSNAVKFTPAGGRVTVRVAQEPSGGIVLVVADTGIGIPEAMQRRVFEPFFQVQSDLARQYQGTGLGLSLVKGLTELHGGSVEVRSRRRHGTVFKVRLPAYRNIGS